MQAATFLPTIEVIDGAKTCENEFYDMKANDYGSKVFESTINDLISNSIVQKGFTDPYTYLDHVHFLL